MIWKQGQATQLGFVVNKSAEVFGLKKMEIFICGGSGLFAEGLECLHTTMKHGDDLVRIIVVHCAKKIRAGTITSI